jgi:hypothetical protein
MAPTGVVVGTFSAVVSKDFIESESDSDPSSLMV